MTFVPFNEVYKTIFTTEFPARSAVEVARDVKVEIEIVQGRGTITIQRQKTEWRAEGNWGHSVLFMGGENDPK